jgi:aspartyl-tRNA(Asn)/glutamyl-tRNA(Gln) amidotransferase subunit A
VSLTHSLNTTLMTQSNSTQRVEQALERAVEVADLNLFAYLDAENALVQAAQLDRETAQGQWRGPLHGLPVTIKDLFNVLGMPTRAGAKAKMPPLQPTEATAVARLRAAGAVILGKTNMVEIALGITGENPWTGDVKNPLDPTRQTGGSSSGSAAAVAAGIGTLSLGTDTAGSIRIPSALCGVVGFKPTFGVVPLDGALPLCWSCDHAGPITRTVNEAAMMFEVLAKQPPKLTKLNGTKLRFGVPYHYLEGALSDEVRQVWEQFLQTLSAGRATLVAMDMDDIFKRTIDVFVPLRAESSITHRHALASEPVHFSPFVHSELERGMRVTAVDYLDALALQKQLRSEADLALRNVDALILPATPTIAQPRGSTEITLESGRTTLRAGFMHLARPFSLLGLPTLSIPFAKIGALPVGLQIVTPTGTDWHTLSIGKRLEEI